MIIFASVNATIAQSVEHFIRNEKVASSSLACGSGIFRKPPRHMLRGLFSSGLCTVSPKIVGLLKTSDFRRLSIFLFPIRAPSRFGSVA